MQALLTVQAETTGNSITLNNFSQLADLPVSSHFTNIALQPRLNSFLVAVMLYDGCSILHWVDQVSSYCLEFCGMFCIYSLMLDVAT